MRQVIWGNELATQILALVFLCLGIDQARMAVVDLECVFAVQQQVQDDRLDKFYILTISTIVWELAGFYVASVWLGWGAICILLSQIWFNLLANVRLQPLAKPAIEHWALAERFPVLLADGIALVLVCLWMLQIAPLSIALTLFGLLVAYGWVKYIFAS
jgi:hypothetical protein